MANLNEHQDREQLSPELESRLRAHYSHIYGDDSQPEAVWNHLVPQLGAQVQRQRAPGGIQLVLQRLFGSTATGFHWRWRATVATALLLLALVGVLAITTWVTPPTVDAQGILQRAEAAAQNPLVRSYHLQATVIINDGKGGPWQIEEWVSGLYNLRLERKIYDTQGALWGAEGTIRNSVNMWGYQTFEGRTTVNHYTYSNPTKSQRSLANLAEVLADAKRNCQSPQLQGEGEIAGRAVYVLRMNPDTQNCTTAKGASPAVGHMMLWLDKQILVPLKWQNYTVDGKPLHRYEVTSIEYDIDIPDSVFTYTPPPGATITESKE